MTDREALIERMAKKLYETTWRNSTVSMAAWDAAPDFIRSEMRTMARAALEVVERDRDCNNALAPRYTHVSNGRGGHSILRCSGRSQERMFIVFADNDSDIPALSDACDCFCAALEAREIEQ